MNYFNETSLFNPNFIDESEKELIIELDYFKPRDYQLSLLDAIINKDYKKAIAIMPRRSGKDFMALFICLMVMLQKRCSVYYIWPTYAQARKAMWKNITMQGKPLLELIDPKLIYKKNSTDMSIQLINGSELIILGSNKIDSIRGANPYMCVFTEYAYQDPRAYEALRPITLGNDGKLIFLTTPNGKNFFFDMYTRAQNNPEWFVQHLTVQDTKHMSIDQIQAEIQSGEMSKDMSMQEYYCDFSQGAQGSFYSQYINDIRLKEQIINVPYEPIYPVNTAWDLGVRDSMSIIFFSVVNSKEIRIIDYYENNSRGLDHYISVIKSKPYNYHKHFAPHDINVRELTTGSSRYKTAKDMGLTFEMRTVNRGTQVDKSSAIPMRSIMDGIEEVRKILPRCWFDENNTKFLIKALENYRKEWDSEKGIYSPKPLHDKYSHAADAFRVLAYALPLLNKSNSSAEELDKRYLDAMYPNKTNFVYDQYPNAQKRGF